MWWWLFGSSSRGVFLCRDLLFLFHASAFSSLKSSTRKLLGWKDDRICEWRGCKEFRVTDRFGGWEDITSQAMKCQWHAMSFRIYISICYIILYQPHQCLKQFYYCFKCSTSPTTMMIIIIMRIWDYLASVSALNSDLPNRKWHGRMTMITE